MSESISTIAEKTPPLNAVKIAEKARMESMPPRGTLSRLKALLLTIRAVQAMLFGKESPLLVEGRVVTAAEALGGTGALKVGADYLKRLLPDANV